MQMSEETNDRAQQAKEEVIKDYEITPNWYDTVDSFEQITSCQNLLRGIYSAGFERPSALQQKGFSAIKKGKDTLVQDEKSDGKASMLAISALSAIDVTIPETQAIIVTGTKKLVQARIALIQQFNELLKASVYGTCQGMEADQKFEEKDQQIVVETPDKALNILTKKCQGSDQSSASFSLKLVIFDKLDDLLQDGFNQQVTQILQLLPVSTQIVATTASSSSSPCSIETSTIIKKFLKHPAIILQYGYPELTLDGIRQFYVDVQREDWKLETILELLDLIAIQQAVIYCSSREKVENLSKKLQEKKLDVQGIHLGTLPLERDRILKKLRIGELKYLVLTDDCLRYFDNLYIYLTINYDIPKNKEFYVKRIGRSGHFGRRSLSISLLVTSEQSWIKEMEQYYATRIEELPMDINDLI